MILSKNWRAVAITATAGCASVALTRCQSATQITITIVTDVDCADHPASLVRTGVLASIEDAATAASSSRCDQGSSPHRIGKLVITPSGGNDQPVAFEVVEAIGQSPEACTPPDYPGCIVARRALKFAQHTNLEITIPMLLSCKNVRCEVAETCVRGICQKADCNAVNGGCDDSALADGGAAQGDGGDAGPAPSTCKGTAGPTMARFDVASAGASFCIDTTEVTNAQLNLFLTTPGTLSLPPECSNKSVATLPSAVTDPSLLNRPASLLSYCDAWAYCAWAGKRLCGNVGGGRAANNANGTNEWVYACTNGVASTYPYGPTYDPAACNTEGDASSSSLLVDVASKQACHGIGPGFSQLFDLSGNVAEIDSYAGPPDDAGTVEVEARGGYVSDGVNARCGFNVTFGQYASTDPEIGFRCCADVTR